MKKRSRTYTYLLVMLTAVLVTLTGCSDEFFNKQAGDRITPDLHYQSTRDAINSMQGAIVTLQEAMPRLIMLNGLRSDMMDVTLSAGLDLIELNDHAISSGNPFTNPSDFYKVIINLNEVLTNIDRVAENEVEFDEYITFSVKGLLIAMRSWTYLTLVRIYNQAAYIEDNMTSLPENLEQHVMSKEVLIDTLINQNIPYVYDASVGTELIEIELDHYVNTKALLGELYLEKNDYANAAFYLKLACESYFNTLSRFKVDKTYKDDGWQTIFLNSETNDIENFTVIPFSSVEDQNNPLASWMGYDYQYVVKPSRVLIDSFQAQIPAAGPLGDPYRGRGVTFDVDSAAMEVSPDYAFITKYELDWGDPFSTDIILTRAADLHLLLAEAYNRMGDEESQEYALMLLNQGVNSVNPKPPPFSKWRSNIGIRGRVYLKPRVIPDGITGEERMRLIEELIIAERAMELAFEGKRWFDLVRIAERRNEPQFLADKVAAKFEGTPRYDEIHSRLMNPENWYLPFE